MGKLDFISILCLSLALIANPLIGMQYCTVHHHFHEKTAETHVHADSHASWLVGLYEVDHKITPLRASGPDFPAEICGCAVHGHSEACESMIPAEFFVPESLSIFCLWGSCAFSAFTVNPVSQDPFQESVIKSRLGQNGFLTFSMGKIRTHLLKNVLVI